MVDCFKRHLTFVFHLYQRAIESHIIPLRNRKQEYSDIDTIYQYNVSHNYSWNHMEMPIHTCRRVDSELCEALVKEIGPYLVVRNWGGLLICDLDHKLTEWSMWSIDTSLPLQISQWKTKSCTPRETIGTFIYATSNTDLETFTVTQSFSNHLE